MLRNLPSTTGLQMFVEAARHESFVKSASVLNVTQAAVSKQIATIERQLQIQLFERGHRCVRVTDAGRRYQKIAESILNLLQEGQEVRDLDQRQKIRVEVDFEFYYFFIVPRIKDLIRHMPLSRFEFVPQGIVPCRPASHTDVWITFGRPSEKGFKVEKICDFMVFPVGSPTLLNGIEDPLATLPLLHDLDTSWWEEILDAEGVDRTDPPIILGQPVLCLAAAMAGQGLAVGDDFLCAEALESGALTQVGNVRLSSRASYWMASPTDRKESEATKAFRDWIATELTTLSKSDGDMPPDHRPEGPREADTARF